MTNEEAIRRIQDYMKAAISPFEEKTIEAIDMAIEALQADAEERHYIKIYADDEPSVKAEKLYQICGETQPKEVTEWLKEYFPDMAIKALQTDQNCVKCEYYYETEDDSGVKSHCKVQGGSDLISRADAIETVCRTRCGDKAKGCPAHSCPVVKEFEALPSAEPVNKDAISREGLLKSWNELSIRGRTEFDQVIMTIPALPSAEPKTGRDCTDFVRWLMDEVMDEENWQLNAVANGEIICRKLKKLGLLDVVDGYYVETQKTGEWVDDGCVEKCKHCGERREFLHWNFCPNCGSFNGGEE